MALLPDISVNDVISGISQGFASMSGSPKFIGASKSTDEKEKNDSERERGRGVKYQQHLSKYITHC